MFEKILAYISYLRKRNHSVYTYDVHKMPERPTFEELLEALDHLRSTGNEPDVAGRVWATVHSSCPSAGALLDEWTKVLAAVRYRASSSENYEAKYYAVYAPWILGYSSDKTADDFLVDGNGLDTSYLDMIGTLHKQIQSIIVELNEEHNNTFWKQYYVNKTALLRNITAAIIMQLSWS